MPLYFKTLAKPQIINWECNKVQNGMGVFKASLCCAAF